MIETINAIEAMGLFWSLRRRDTQPPDYRAVIWSALINDPEFCLSAEASSPTLALANAFAVAKRALGVPEGPPVPVTVPEAGAKYRQTVHPKGSQGPAMGTGEEPEPAVDLDDFHGEPL
jgi:hypothetical protein